MATTTEIRQQYNDLLNGRYHWQQGISKFWNKNVNDAISKIGDEIVYENGGEFMTTPKQLIVNETPGYTQYNEATFWNSSIIYDWESDTYHLIYLSILLIIHYQLLVLQIIAMQSSISIEIFQHL